MESKNFDELADYLAATDKMHLAFARTLLEKAFNNNQEIINALQSDNAHIRHKVRIYINKHSRIPLALIFGISGAAVFAVLIQSKLAPLSMAWLLCIAMLGYSIYSAKTHFYYVRRLNLVIDALAAKPQIIDVAGAQSIANKHSKILKINRLDEDVRKWNIKDFLVAWIVID